MVKRQLKNPKKGACWLSWGYVWVTVVILISLIPPPDLSISEFASIDKVLHCLVYAFLMLWFTQVYVRGAFWVLALYFIGLGICLELLQSLTNYRSMEIADTIANTAGVALGWVLALMGLSNVLQSWTNSRFEKGFDPEVIIKTE